MTDLAIDSDRGTISAARLMKDSSVRGQRYGARSHYGPYSVERRIPKPYPTERFKWTPFRNIARLPSVIAEDIVTGPTRTISPQKISVHSDAQVHRSQTEIGYPDLSEREMRGLRVQDWSPFKKWSRQKLGWMSGQQRYLGDFPLACAIRSNINQLITRMRGR